jgi:TonB family protein
MKKIIFTIALAIAFIANASGQEISFSVDAFPTNIGGKTEFKRVFEQELLYPQNALANKISGKVTFNFIVKKDSTISEITTTDSGNPELNAEAMRIFKLYQWVPAVKSGEYVSTRWDVTINFEAEKYAKICKNRGFTIPKYMENKGVDSSGMICKKPDQFPVYYKGTYALQDFLKANLEYPRQAQVSNIQGTVIVRFTVEPDGYPSNIGIQKSVGGGCDQEATRLIEMTKWQPGIKDGKLIRTQMTLPIYFILNEDFKDNSSGEQK